MEELQNDIVIYNPSEDINLEVRVAEDTVWLTQAQMAKLLGTTSQNITLHIKNIYREHELEIGRTCKDFLQVQREGERSVKRNIKTYNLDVIISVGYRVKSIQGTLFRLWATKIIKAHILKGYTINYQLTTFQQNVEHRLESHDLQIQSINQRIDEMVQTALPPKYGLFFNGQVFDAYVFVVDLIKSANKSIRLVDNYIDESVLLMLSKRNEAVAATIFTEKISQQLTLDLRKHNAQYPPIASKRIEKVHDRFLIIDDERLYHFGASFKDLGKKLFVVTLIEEPALVGAVGKMFS